MTAREAGEGWLVLATGTDVLLALGAGVGGAMAVEPDVLGNVTFVVAFVGCAFGFSFVNHVFGMWLARASLGKLLWALRVVRVNDGGRPGFWRSIGRWLLGFAFLAVMAIAEDGGGVGEAAGLRTVRRRDLRGYANDGTYRV
ncbi:RDD family protein [Streptomyces sp. 3MP-14]|uniref:RDD family protein n=1 Tax=Streptomyces mimosae TaxID=2586635 RepID=A0A5N6A7J1_9ACTN|nr:MULTISPECIES: RDD family protein [Streptomyces]KAB8164621.1 RDD family protein [Streptomyces mimosae]KAB8175537.1 RDD family protein [Streptomyces sp. 3MP-14]